MLDNSAVSDRICELYLNEKLADIKFEFDNDNGTELVPAHKTILAVASPVFCAWFFGDGEENGLVNKVGKSVKIVDASAAAFKEFLQFFYLQKVSLTIEYIDEVVLLADKYDVLDIVNTCITFLVDQLEIDDMIWGYQLALTLQNMELKEFCEEHIKLHARNVLKSDIFPHCDRIVLKNILKMDDLQCQESDIFDACIEWARFNCKKNGLDEKKMENLREQLRECFYLIRFCTMGMNIFLQHTEPFKELFTQDEINEIIFHKKTSQFDQNSRPRRLFQWNNANVIKCVARTSKHSFGKTMPPEASIQFSTNVPALFGGFRMCHIVCPHRKDSIACDYEVFEIDNDSIRIALHCTGRFSLPSTKDHMISPTIVMSPNRIYEIRLKFCSNVSVNVFGSIWDNDYKLNDKLTVKILINERFYFSALLFNSI